MKKSAYSIILILSITLICISCSKENDENDDAITVNDLVGDWHFQSLTFNGVVYDTEQELVELDVNYSYIQISLVNVTTTSIGLCDHRGNPPLSTYDGDYTLSKNIVDFYANGWSGGFVFYINNWETFDGTILELKLISSKASSEAPIDGVYTLTR